MAEKTKAAPFERREKARDLDVSEPRCGGGERFPSEVNRAYGHGPRFNRMVWGDWRFLFPFFEWRTPWFPERDVAGGRGIVSALGLAEC